MAVFPWLNKAAEMRAAAKPGLFDAGG